LVSGVEHYKKYININGILKNMRDFSNEDVGERAERVGREMEWARIFIDPDATEGEKILRSIAIGLKYDVPKDTHPMPDSLFPYTLTTNYAYSNYKLRLSIFLSFFQIIFNFIIF